MISPKTWLHVTAALCCLVATPDASAAGKAKAPCRLLLVNDDGIAAPGIRALYEALKGDCELVVVAPSSDQSGASHAVTNLRGGLTVRTVPLGPGANGYAVDGTPAEAAGLGLTALSGGRRFDLVVLGINPGENTGLANLYSGTINAGIEALVRDTPAIAISQDSSYGNDFTASARIARALVQRVLANPLPRGVMLNVNVPANFHGVSVVPARGLSTVLAGFDATPGKDGTTIYRPRMHAESTPPAGGDVAAYIAGRITITPLALDRSARGVMRSLAPLASHVGY